jgi:hypothetical protein
MQRLRLTQTVMPSNGSRWADAALSLAIVLVLAVPSGLLAQETTDGPRAGRSPFTPSLGSATTPGQNPTGNQDPANGPLGNSATQVLPDPRANEQRTTSLNDQAGTAGWQQHVPGSPQPGSPNDPPAEITKVSQSFSQLPNDGGQVWREYDIRPYTLQMSAADKPEQALTEWILKHTGTEMWFAEPLGILHASREKVIVYHTPEVHNQIKPIIDRFNYTQGQKVSAQVNLVTVGSPNWREVAYPYLEPIAVSSQHVEAWLVSRENAALLLNQLSRRSDYRSHAAGTMTVANGQKLELKKETPTQFIRSLRWTPGNVTPVQPIMAQINEGYSLSISFLNSLDGQSIESSITCNVDQIEKLTQVKIPTSLQAQQRGLIGRAAATTDTINLNIPQFVSWRLHERVRWPVDHVLLISCGVVATPNTDGGRPNSGIGQLLAGGASRADALLFIDYRGPGGPMAPQTAGGIPDSMRAIAPK